MSTHSSGGYSQMGLLPLSVLQKFNISVSHRFGPLIDRPLWTQWDKAFVEPDGDEHYPATFLWASNFNSTVSFDTVAAQYGSQSSSIARIRQDHMTLDMRRIHEHANVSAIVDKLVKQAWPKVGNGDNPHDAWAKADTAMLPYLAGGRIGVVPRRGSC